MLRQIVYALYGQCTSIEMAHILHLSPQFSIINMKFPNSLTHMIALGLYHGWLLSILFHGISPWQIGIISMSLTFYTSHLCLFCSSDSSKNETMTHRRSWPFVSYLNLTSSYPICLDMWPRFKVKRSTLLINWFSSLRKNVF